VHRNSQRPRYTVVQLQQLRHFTGAESGAVQQRAIPCTHHVTVDATAIEIVCRVRRLFERQTFQLIVPPPLARVPLALHVFIHFASKEWSRHWWLSGWFQQREHKVGELVYPPWVSALVVSALVVAFTPRA